MAEPRRAVVVGVNKYMDVKIPELKGAANDALEMRRTLIDSGGFQIEDSHVLLDKDATCQAVRKAISDLLWKTEACSLALFYFSGHGFEDGRGNGYIAPHDMASNEPFVCGIRMQELRELV